MYHRTLFRYSKLLIRRCGNSVFRINVLASNVIKQDGRSEYSGALNRSKGLPLEGFSPWCVLFLLIVALGGVSRPEETRYVVIQRALLHDRNDLRTDLFVLQNRPAGLLELLYQLLHRHRRISTVILMVVLRLDAVPLLADDLVLDRMIVALVVETSIRPRVALVVVMCVVKIPRSPRRLIIAVVSVSAIIDSGRVIINDITAVIVSGFKSDTSGLLDDGRPGLVQGEVGVGADRNLSQVDLFHLARVTTSIGVAVRSMPVCNAQIVSKAATSKRNKRSDCEKPCYEI